VFVVSFNKDDVVRVTQICTADEFLIFVILQGNMEKGTKLECRFSGDVKGREEGGRRGGERPPGLSCPPSSTKTLLSF